MWPTRVIQEQEPFSVHEVIKKMSEVGIVENGKSSCIPYQFGMLRTIVGARNLTFLDWTKSRSAQACAVQ
jgi:hypothetical protein